MNVSHALRERAKGGKGERAKNCFSSPLRPFRIDGLHATEKRLGYAFFVAKPSLLAGGFIEVFKRSLLCQSRAETT